MRLQIPQIVRRRMQAGRLPDVHPDPNLLSAFAEKSLRQGEHTQVMVHLAQCGECRHLLSVAMPEWNARSERAAALPGSGAWLSWPVLRWVAAGASLAIVGTAVLLYRPKPQSTLMASRDQAVAIASPETLASSLPANTVAPATRALKSRREAPAPATMRADLAPSDKTSTVPEQKRDSLQKAANRVAPPASTAETVEVTGAAPMINTEVIPGRAKDAAVDTEGANMGNSTSASAQFAQRVGPMQMAVANKGMLRAPNLAPRWTLSSDGTLQRSMDSGRTWETVPVSSNAKLRALAANGLEIWVGGAAGALYHSADAGQHWSQVQLTSNGQPLSEDIIGVEFTDRQHGRIGTASQETWTTTDAGQTWQKR